MEARSASTLTDQALVELEIGPAGSIWVNPWWVRFIGAAEGDTTSCVVHFDKHQYVPVQESAAAVVAKLSGPG